MTQTGFADKNPINPGKMTGLGRSPIAHIDYVVFLRVYPRTDNKIAG